MTSTRLLRRAAPVRSQHDALARALSEVAQQSGVLGVELVDVAGGIDAVAARVAEQVRTFDALQDAAASVQSATSEVTAAAGEVGEGAQRAVAQVEESQEQIAGSHESMDALAGWLGGLESQLSDVTRTLAGVEVVAHQIDRIAVQTHILALNARIEAARSGEAGRGFAVIADSVRQLSEQTLRAASDISSTLNGLSEPLRVLQEQSADAGTRAGVAAQGSALLGQVLRDVEQALSRVGVAADEISGRAGEAGARVAETTGLLAGLTTGVAVSRDLLSDASTRTNALLRRAEDLLGTVVSTGVATPDSPFIAAVQRTAAEIGRLFERELDAGRVTLDELFDERYVPVPHTDPQQVTTKFTALTDRLLPALQEPLLDLDPRVVFCAAVDRNGYLPTHNAKFSQRQGRDPVWNAAHCRNRRLFDDRTGLAAGRGTGPFLLQTYRRDMGGGTFALMKDLSAPITVRGRHWGGFRMGYRV